MKPHRLSCGVVVIRPLAEGCRYLLLRAYNYWDFPKGEVQQGESPEAAARRETAEETGLTRLDFRWGDQYTETPPYGHGKVARYYVAVAEEASVTLAVDPELGRPEHHEYRWVDYAQARQLLNERVQAVLQWAARVTGCEEKP